MKFRRTYRDQFYDSDLDREATADVCEVAPKGDPPPAYQPYVSNPPLPPLT